MADTIAVMNDGRIEQIGAPADALREPADDLRRELPRPVQPADRADGGPGRRALRGRLRRSVRSRCSPTGCRSAAEQALLVGVRPEKIQLRPADGEVATGENRLTGGVVIDASFTGVSTQYLVRLPWGQQAVGVRPEHGPGRAVRPAARRSTSSGSPSTPSPSRATPPPAPGRRIRRGPARPVRSGRRRSAPRPAERRHVHRRRGPHRGHRRPRRRAGGRAPRPPPLDPVPPPAARPALAGDLLRRSRSSPCFGTSLQTPDPAARSARSTRPSASPTTWTPSSEYAPQFLRSFVYAGIATVLCLAHRVPAGVHDRLQGGRWRNLLLVLVIAPFFTQLPPADPGVAADPRRGGLRRPDPEVRCTSCRRGWR